MTLVQYARTKGWELGDVRVAVDYDHHSTPRRFDVAVEFGGDLTDAQLERLARVARVPAATLDRGRDRVPRDDLAPSRERAAHALVGAGGAS